jgi:hypothetical protein
MRRGTRGIGIVAALLAMIPCSAVAAPPLHWSTPRSIDPAGLLSVSCASASLCVAGDRAGGVVVSTDPADPSPTWTLTNVDGTTPIGAMSCPSATLCVAGDRAGLVLASTNPAGPAPTWSTAQPGGPMFSTLIRHPGQVLPPGVQGIACASVSLCVAAVYPDFNESIAYGISSSTNPAGGTAAWSLYSGFGSGLTFEVGSCPSVTLCVLSDQSGSIAWNSNPTGMDWNVIKVDKLNAIPAISCPTRSLCVAADFFGDIITSTRPTHSGWKRALRVDGYNAFTGVSCPATTLCVAVDVRGNVFTSRHPTAGKSAWHKDRGFGRALHVSCPTSSLCVAVDRGGRVIVGTRVA